MILRCISIIVFLLSSLALAAERPKTFVTGVWQSPANLFPRWKEHGITHIFTDKPKPDNATLDEYMRQASEAGLKVFISEKPAVELGGFAGFMQPDEPENWNKRIKMPDGRWDMPATTLRYQRGYAQYKSGWAGAVVFGNFNGMQLTGTRDGPRKPDGDIIKSDYVEYFKGADWLGGDWYVINTGRDAEKIPQLVGGMVDRLREWSGEKPVFAFVESSHQRLPNVPNGRAPTPSEMRATAWAGVIHGACGLVYFPLRLGGSFQFDATPPENLAAIKALNSELTGLSDFIIRGKWERQAGEAAKWSMPDGSTLSAKMTWNVSAKRWDVETAVHRVAGGDAEALRRENAALKVRLERWESWYRSGQNN